MDDDTPPHGDIRRYRPPHKCRCDDCRLAGARNRKARELQKYELGLTTLRVPTYRARRRVQALMALGYSLSFIQKATAKYGPHIAKHSLNRIVSRHRVPKFVMWDTFQKIDAVYQEYAYAPLPEETAFVKNTRTHAFREGFVPPAAWDDIDDPDEVRNPKRSLLVVSGWRATRRLQALAAQGYSSRFLARKINHPRLNDRYLRLYTQGKYDAMPYELFEKINKVYEELKDAPEPDSKYARMAADKARDKGWLPSSAWRNIDLLNNGLHKDREEGAV